MVEYMSYFNVSMSNEMLDIIKEIEVAFEVLEYSDHIENIMAVYDGRELPLFELRNNSLAIYIEHVHYVLLEQGITLVDNMDINLSMLSDILTAVTIMGSSDTSQYIDLLDSESDDVDKLGNLIGLILGIEPVMFFGLITYVDPLVFEYLYLQDDSEIGSLISERAKKRFKKAYNPKGPELESVRLIKLLDRFGYSSKIYLNQLTDFLSTQTNSKIITEELLLYILGSSTADEHLDRELVSIVETVLLVDPILMIKVLTGISNIDWSLYNE